MARWISFLEKYSDQVLPIKKQKSQKSSNNVIDDNLTASNSITKTDKHYISNPKSAMSPEITPSNLLSPALSHYYYQKAYPICPNIPNSYQNNNLMKYSSITGPTLINPLSRFRSSNQISPQISNNNSHALIQNSVSYQVVYSNSPKYSELSNQLPYRLYPNPQQVSSYLDPYVHQAHRTNQPNMQRFRQNPDQSSYQTNFDQYIRK